ncbi:DUF1080 domain-containing protein [Fulvivirgaceae bacterium BMA12]|uniref:DUF1080 domain-containing protein n=1 Tax=Agaribacillus aureus TaxID=3051825 RepID=A0ABT8L617_9BACT|nr:DUF1080 domain-containing protein [Fulvivirgaceae bacterium BMA12]
MNKRYNFFSGLSMTTSCMIAVLLSFAISRSHAQSDSGADVISLFNGKDLNGWYTYQRKPEPTSKVAGLKMENGKYVEPIGLNEDPLKVFTVVEEDGAPAIRISGEVFGILVTDQAYENYHLSIAFKWGKKKYPPREDRKRDSGILYHSVGKEGVRGGVWMRSVECQVQEGDVGDLWCVDSTTAQVKTVQLKNKKFKYDPQAPFQTIDMRGDRFCQKSRGFERKHGEWNQLDIYVYGRESVHVINGQKNMHLSEIGQIVNGKIEPLTKGKIQIQSEGAEVFYRNITIRSIEEIPHFNEK